MKQIKVFFVLFISVLLGSFASHAQNMTGEIVSNKLQEKAQILNDCLMFLSQKDRSVDIKSTI